MTSTISAPSITAASVTADVAGWQQRFAVCRLGSPIVSAAAADSSWAEAATQFREVTVRVRQVHDSRCFVPASQSLMAAYWQECLALSQLLASEFQRPDRAPTRLVQELLDDVSHRLRRLEQQLLLVDLTQDVLETLQPWSQELLAGGNASWRQLLQLAEELNAALRRCPLRPAMVSWDTRWVATTLEQGGLTDVEFYISAIVRARVCAELSAQVANSDASQVRILTAAALVQDVGLLHDPHGKARPTSSHMVPQATANLLRRQNPNHPGMAAGLLSLLPGCPVVLPLLAGSHHERLDGSGYPQRLVGERLSRDAQWLIVVTRFVELLSDPETLRQAPAEPDESLFFAGLRLWREVQRGAMPEALSTRLLQAVQPGLAELVAEGYRQRQRRMIDPSHGVPAPRGRVVNHAEPDDTLTAGYRTDRPPAGRVIAAPAFYRRQRGRDQRPVLVPNLARVVSRLPSELPTTSPSASPPAAARLHSSVRIDPMERPEEPYS